MGTTVTIGTIYLKDELRYLTKSRGVEYKKDIFHILLGKPIRDEKPFGSYYDSRRKLKEIKKRKERWEYDEGGYQVESLDYMFFETKCGLNKGFRIQYYFTE